MEVQPEQILLAALSEFTDIAQVHFNFLHLQMIKTFPHSNFAVLEPKIFQVCVRCPFEYGVLDGIVFLLYQLLAQVRKSQEHPINQNLLRTVPSEHFDNPFFIK